MNGAQRSFWKPLTPVFGRGGSLANGRGRGWGTRSRMVQTKIENSIQLFSKKILEHEITDIIQEIQHIHKNIIFFKRKIINVSTLDFFTQLYNKQLPTFKKIASKTRISLNNKLENLNISQLPKLITDKEN